MSFRTMHDDYLDPDKSGMFDEPAFFEMPVFDNGGSGAHCGLTDWYPEKEAELKAALESGLPFDTGWYSSKKQIASARIHSDDGEVVKVEVSVSDDFDTEGMGYATCEPTIDAVTEAIDKAWSDAEANQKDNRQYVGYSLLHWTTTPPSYSGRTKRYPKKQPFCMDYLILPAGDYNYEDAPPGDNYYFWGWQNDCDHDNDGDCGHKCVEKGITEETAEQLRNFAEQGKPGSLRIGDWEIKAWDDDE